MANQVPVNIQSCLAICNSLASLIHKSYGPNAQLVMYTTSTGKVLLTSDGSSILGALHVSHPIGRWLIGRIRTLGHHTGDHTKSFLLLVRTILDGISHEVSSSLKRLEPRCESILREKTIRLVRALTVILQEIIPQKVFPALVEKSQRFSGLDLKALNKFGENLMYTYLHGRLSLKHTSFMSKLLWKFITGSTNTSVSSIRDASIDLQDNFGIASLEAVGLPIESSNIREGIILSRCFVKDLNERKGGVQRRFIIFGFDPSKTSMESSATISARTVQDLVHNMQHTRLQMVRIVHLLQDKAVSVVLCSECLPAALLSLLEQASITVIQTVPLEELQRLSHIARINILYETPRELDASCMAVAKEVKEVTLGNHRYSHIVIGCGSGVSFLVLCAPSEGMCRVLSQAALGAIKCVKVWLDADLQATGTSDIMARSAGAESRGSEDPAQYAPLEVEHCENHKRSRTPKLQPSQSVCNVSFAGSGGAIAAQTGFLISGGGAAEFIARDVLLQSLPAYKDDHYQYAAINIISNALQCIPRTIYENSFAAQSKDGRSFIKIIDNIQIRSQSTEAWGIDGKSGEVCCTFNRGVVEVVTGKYLLWCSVIETVIELLNMDTIIPVQRILKDTDSEDEEDI